MTKLIKVITPDIGDFDVPIIELLIKDGDTVEIDQPLITIESDKAMEIPGIAELLKNFLKLDKIKRHTNLRFTNRDISFQSVEKTNPILSHNPT